MNNVAIDKKKLKFQQEFCILKIEDFILKIKTKNHEKIYTNHNIWNNIFTC